MKGMRIRGVMVVVALAGPAASAASADDPAAFVRSVYGRYGANGPGVGMDAAGRSFYTRSLLEAFARDRRQAKGEIGAIDSDPICACQDYDLTLKSVSIETASDAAATARATFVNFGKRTTVTLHLERTSAGWRIDDVGSRDIPSVKALLAQSAKSGN